MEELVNTLKDLNPEVLFIVVVSAALNKYLAFTKIKAIIPAVLALLCAFALAEPFTLRSVLKTWFMYAGQGTLFYETYKFGMKKLTSMKKGD